LLFLVGGFIYENEDDYPGGAALGSSAPGGAGGGGVYQITSPLAPPHQHLQPQDYPTAGLYQPSSLPSLQHIQQPLNIINMIDYVGIGQPQDYGGGSLVSPAPTYYTTRPPSLFPSSSSGTFVNQAGGAATLYGHQSTAAVSYTLSPHPGSAFVPQSIFTGGGGGVGGGGFIEQSAASVALTDNLNSGMSNVNMPGSLGGVAGGGAMAGTPTDAGMYEFVDFVYMYIYGMFINLT